MGLLFSVPAKRVKTTESKPVFPQIFIYHTAEQKTSIQKDRRIIRKTLLFFS